MNKNDIEGVSSGISVPRSAKSSGQAACVNVAVVCQRFNNLSGEASACGDAASMCPSKHRSGSRDTAVIIDRGVSKGHISRGDELTKGRTDSRSGEGLQYEWQMDLPLDGSSTRRPQCGASVKRQHSHLQSQLLEAILSESNLSAAYRRVKANGGAAGIDGVELPQFPLWYRLRRASLLRRLRLGNYVPSAVRRCYIPKSNGTKRPLGVPNLFDRIVQQAIHQVLSPRLEPSFSKHSYGFRPKRGCQQAVRALHGHIKDGYRWSIDVDLKSFFDTVPHDRALKALRDHLDGDGPVVRLIERYLKAGYIELDQYHATTEGMPQGGPLSPLLSNLVLDALDTELQSRGHRFVRYADDFIVVVKTRRAAERVFASICLLIEGGLGLTVNRDKSAVRPVRELSYLGFSFRLGKIVVSESSLAELKYRLKRYSARSWSVSMRHRLYQLRQYVRGWMGYYGLSEVHSVWLPLDQWLRRRIRMCYWRQWKTSKRRYLNLVQLGTSAKFAGGFARSSKGYWRLAHGLGAFTAMTNKWLEAEGLTELRQLWWNFKFLRITALKQTA